MSKLRKIYELMMLGAVYEARWEKQMADNILRSKKEITHTYYFAFANSKRIYS